MFPFLKSALSEPTGQGSFGRSAFAFVIAIVMGCIVFTIVKKRLDPTLDQWAWFLVTVGGVTYCSSKIAYAWGSNKIESSASSVNSEAPKQ